MEGKGREGLDLAESEHQTFLGWGTDDIVILEHDKSG